MAMSKGGIAVVAFVAGVAVGAGPWVLERLEADDVRSETALGPAANPKNRDIVEEEEELEEGEESWDEEGEEGDDWADAEEMEEDDGDEEEGEDAEEEAGEEDDFDIDEDDEERPPDPNSKDPVERAYAKVHRWIADATQIRDAAKREAAFTAIRTALEGDDPMWQGMAMDALRSLGEVKYDKASFRPAVMRHVQSSNPAMRAGAIMSLPATVGTSGDLELVMGYADDPSPEVRQAVAHALVFLSQKDLHGRASDTMVQLLSDRHPRVVRRAVNLSWGVTAEKPLYDRLLELHAGGDRRLSRDALYFGLSTLPQKNPEVVAALLKAVESNDHNVYGRALWGLGYGVAKSEHDTVADTILRLLDSRSGSGIQADCWRLLAKYAGERQRGPLQELAGNQLASEATRAAAAGVLKRIDQRRDG